MHVLRRARDQLKLSDAIGPKLVLKGDQYCHHRKSFRSWPRPKHYRGAGRPRFRAANTQERRIIQALAELIE